MTDVSQFSIYRSAHKEPKRVEESRVLMPFLLRLERFVRLDGVEHGPDSPDFVFRHKDKTIGVELTGLVPKPFEKGGFVEKREFKLWKAEHKATPQPRHEFEWPEFTARQSLGAFTKQLDTKARKVKTWKAAFPEKWLLMQVDSGSPFGGLFASRRHDTPGSETEVTDHFAKITHSVYSICQRPHPFSYIIFFSGQALLAFPTGGTNPFRLPVPSIEVLTRGAAASDNLLDWRHANTSIVEHPPFE